MLYGPLKLLARLLFGGGGGNWTRVRQSAACGSTCLVQSLNLVGYNPTVRAHNTRFRRAKPHLHWFASFQHLALFLRDVWQIVWQFLKDFNQTKPNLRKPKTVEGVPPFLSDGTPIFLYYYQSARTNWNRFWLYNVPSKFNLRGHLMAFVIKV